jgi:inorganic pyrophosphatase
MSYEPVSVGDDAPEVVNLIIEIQRGGGKNKYEVDKKTYMRSCRRY